MAAKKPPTANQKTKVLLVDDHPVVRQGLAQLINQDPDLVICAEAENGPQAFEAITRTNPHVAVVDITLGDYDGIELIKNIKATHPELPLLVLSMHDESLYCERALRAGAKGYIMKQEATTNVLTAIRRVLKGELFLSDKMKQRMIHQLVSGKPKSSESPVERLSDRELEVFRLIGRGHGTRQAAEKLHLSVKTIETHRSHIMEKLGLHSPTELAQCAFQWVHSQARP
jgi:DNA-binding NarL/FixJ family response regulator